MHQAKAPFVLQVVGYKNSGKTTLVASLIRHLKSIGLTVGTIKHDAHDFTMDTPGTDTWKHQEAGADVTAISSSLRSAILFNGPQPLEQLLEQMSHADAVLVEGFKQAHFPKFVLIRGEEDLELLEAVSNIAAVIVCPAAEPLLPQLASRYPAFERSDLDRITRHLFALYEHAGRPHPS